MQPRPVRGKRSDEDGNWPSTKWDQLSDVDYWAQVASDKPLTTTAQPAAQSAQPAPARTGPPRDPDTRHGQSQGSRTGTAPERSAAARPGSRLPVRGARQPAAAGLAAPAPWPGGFSPAPHAAVTAPPESPARPPALPGGDLRPAARPMRDAAPPGAHRPGPVYDDDPLTSPSFPKIPASDSRSYGGVRPETPPSGSRILPPQATDATQHLAPYRSPSGQFNGYDGAGRQHAEPASGFGPPGSLPADPGGLPPYRPAPADPGRHGGRAAPLSPPPGLPLSPPPSLPARPGGYEGGYLPPAGAPLPAPAPVLGAPSGNPYGSYVSSPAASYQPRSAAPPDGGLPVGYSGPAAPDPVAQRGSPYPPPAAAGEHSPAGGGPAGGWYPDLPAPTVPSASYLDTSRPLPPAGNPGGTHLNGNADLNGSGNLNGSGHGTSTGNGHPQGAGYPPAQHEPPAQYEPPSYLPPGYLPPGYPAGRQEPAGYAGYAGSDPYGRDPYGQDPYGGYPGYGAADS